MILFVLKLTSAVASTLAPPPTNLTCGISVYPLPPSMILTAETVPVVKSTCAVPVAVVPPAPSGGSNTTVGTPVYPSPVKSNVTLATFEK